MIEASKIPCLIKNQLLSRTEYYELYGQLDDLSGGARIEDIEVIDISYDKRVDGGTEFTGTFLIKAVKDVGLTSSSFTGIFEGHFDEADIYLESASLDISSTSDEGYHDKNSNLG
jgi:hypothetical protein